MTRRVQTIQLTGKGAKVGYALVSFMMYALPIWLFLRYTNEIGPVPASDRAFLALGLLWIAKQMIRSYIWFNYR